MIRSALIATLLLCAVSACSSSSTKPLSTPQPDRASEINLDLGIDYFRKGNLAAAKDKIDKAVEQNPRNARAQSTAGLLYDRLNEPKKSDSHFEKAIALDPKNPQTAARMIPPLGRWKRFDEGRQALMKAELERILAQPGLSRDVTEQASKSLLG